MTAPARSRRRRLLERTWILASVAYGGLRILVADRTVRRYGVNIWGFAAVELSTSWLYGLSTARVVAGFVDRRIRQAAPWAVAAAATFLAPETYILLTGHHMPAAVYVVVATLLVTLGTVAVVSLVRRIRAASAARAALAAAEATTASLTPP